MVIEMDATSFVISLLLWVVFFAISGLLILLFGHTQKLLLCMFAGAVLGNLLFALWFIRKTK